MSLWSKHAVFEKNSIILLIGSLIMAYNLWMTVRAGEVEAQAPVALQPAE